MERRVRELSPSSVSFRLERCCWFLRELCGCGDAVAEENSVAVCVPEM